MNVVSFFAPRTDHPFYQDYTPYLDLLRASCAKFGHRHIVLTDDPSVGRCDDAYVVEGLPHSLMKAVTAAQYAYLSDPQFAYEPTLLLGADCVLGRDPVEVFQGENFDLGITVCDEFLDCRMNTGAIFIPNPLQIAEIWGNALEHVGDDWGDDQTSLYRAILERPSHGAWRAVVREFPVDPYNLAPEHPGDDCRRGVVLHFRGPRKRWMAAYCAHYLGIGKAPDFDLIENTDTKQALENVKKNCAGPRRFLFIEERPEHKLHAVLVGGGPSLADSLPEIQRRKADGQVIFGLNGAAKWLNDHGVRPDYCVILDKRASNAAFVGHADVHIFASQCDPAVFEAAKGTPVSVYHFNDPALYWQISEVSGAGVFVGGGFTVGITAMALVHAMGYRQQHLYGYDCSASPTSEGHAYAQDETNAEAMRVEVWCGSEKFYCQPAMAYQAKIFPEWAGLLTDNGAHITLHGSGLLPSYVRAINAERALEGVS